MIETVVNRLKTFIANGLNLNINEIDENAQLFEGGLNIDSIAVMHLLELIQNEFNIIFSDTELSPDLFKTLNILANIIVNKIQSSPLLYHNNGNIGHLKNLGPNAWLFYRRAFYFGISYSDLFKAEQAAYDWSTWGDALAQLADKYFYAAKEAWAKKRIASAVQLWRNATDYYHFAQINHSGKEKKEYQKLSRKAFAKMAPLLTPSCQKIDIPFQNYLLPGYLRVAKPNARCVILIGGLYYEKEVELHKLAEIFLARGLSVVYFDGPGQGEVIEKIPMRLDFENAVSKVIDFLSYSSLLVDTSKIGLFGISIGGYLAVRSAAKDKRIGACISLSGFFNKEGIKTLHPFSKDLITKMFNIDSIETLIGADDPMSLANLSDFLTCPLFIVHGGKDHLIPYEQVKLMKSWAKGETKVLIIDDADHACFSHFNEILPVIGDWMTENLYNICQN